MNEQRTLALSGTTHSHHDGLKFDGLSLLVATRVPNRVSSGGMVKPLVASADPASWPNRTVVTRTWVVPPLTAAQYARPLANKPSAGLVRTVTDAALAAPAVTTTRAATKSEILSHLMGFSLAVMVPLLRGNDGADRAVLVDERAGHGRRVRHRALTPGRRLGVQEGANERLGLVREQRVGPGPQHDAGVAEHLDGHRHPRRPAIAGHTRGLAAEHVGPGERGRAEDDIGARRRDGRAEQGEAQGQCIRAKSTGTLHCGLLSKMD